MKHSGKTHTQQAMNLKSVPILLVDLSIFGCRRNTFLYRTDEVRAFRERKTRNTCINLTVLFFDCCKRKRWGSAGQGWWLSCLIRTLRYPFPFHKLSAGAALLCSLKVSSKLAIYCLGMKWMVYGCCDTSVLCHIWLKALAYSKGRGSASAFKVLATLSEPGSHFLSADT